jgi:ABC-type nitrate/sulfonate/bicarbonate transport system substrate-binding protein
MRRIKQLYVSTLLLIIGAGSHPAALHAQERMKIAYSSADASNAVWFLALDAGLYRKHGLDVELVFIQSSTTSVSSVIAGDIQVANTSGGAVASAVVGGANLIMTACYINTYPMNWLCRNRCDRWRISKERVWVSAVSGALRM